MDSKIKVLSIDDDAALTELLSLLLGTHGFTVETANSGPEGIEKVRTWKPDVVLLDIMMPGMDGWETCQRIRAFDDVPIIMFSALSMPGLVARALDMGADEFLVKPVSSDLLVAHIKKIVRRRRPAVFPTLPSPAVGA